MVIHHPGMGVEDVTGGLAGHQLGLNLGQGGAAVVTMYRRE